MSFLICVSTWQIQIKMSGFFYYNIAFEYLLPMLSFTYISLSKTHYICSKNILNIILIIPFLLVEFCKIDKTNYFNPFDPWSPRITEAKKQLRKPSSSISLNKSQTLEELAQNCSSWILNGSSSSGQHFLVLNTLMIKKYFGFQGEFPVFLFISIASYPVILHHWEESCTTFFTSSPSDFYTQVRSTWAFFFSMMNRPSTLSLSFLR